MNSHTPNQSLKEETAKAIENINIKAMRDIMAGNVVDEDPELTAFLHGVIWSKDKYDMNDPNVSIHRVGSQVLIQTRPDLIKQYGIEFFEQVAEVNESNEKIVLSLLLAFKKTQFDHFEFVKLAQKCFEFYKRKFDDPVFRHAAASLDSLLLSSLSEQDFETLDYYFVNCTFYLFSSKPLAEAVFSIIENASIRKDFMSQRNLILLILRHFPHAGPKIYRMIIDRLSDESDWTRETKDAFITSVVKALPETIQNQLLSTLWLDHHDFKDDLYLEWLKGHGLMLPEISEVDREWQAAFDRGREAIFNMNDQFTKKVQYVKASIKHLKEEQKKLGENAEEFHKIVDPKNDHFSLFFIACQFNHNELFEIALPPFLEVFKNLWDKKKENEKRVFNLRGNLQVYLHGNFSIACQNQSFWLARGLKNLILKLVLCSGESCEKGIFGTFQILFNWEMNRCVNFGLKDVILNHMKTMVREADQFVRIERDNVSSHYSYMIACHHLTILDSWLDSQDKEKCEEYKLFLSEQLFNVKMLEFFTRKINTNFSVNDDFFYKKALNIIKKYLRMRFLEKLRITIAKDDHSEIDCLLKSNQETFQFIGPFNLSDPRLFLKVCKMGHRGLMEFIYEDTKGACLKGSSFSKIKKMIPEKSEEARQYLNSLKIQKEGIFHRSQTYTVQTVDQIEALSRKKDELERKLSGYRDRLKEMLECYKKVIEEARRIGEDDKRALEILRSRDEIESSYEKYKEKSKELNEIKEATSLDAFEKNLRSIPASIELGFMSYGKKLLDAKPKPVKPKKIPQHSLLSQKPQKKELVLSSRSFLAPSSYPDEKHEKEKKLSRKERRAAEKMKREQEEKEYNPSYSNKYEIEQDARPGYKQETLHKTFPNQNPYQKAVIESKEVEARKKRKQYTFPPVDRDQIIILAKQHLNCLYELHRGLLDISNPISVKDIEEEEDNIKYFIYGLTVCAFEMLEEKSKEKSEEESENIRRQRNLLVHYLQFLSSASLKSLFLEAMSEWHKMGLIGDEQIGDLNEINLGQFYSFLKNKMQNQPSLSVMSFLTQEKREQRKVNNQEPESLLFSRLEQVNQSLNRLNLYLEALEEKKDGRNLSKKDISNIRDKAIKGNLKASIYYKAIFQITVIGDAFNQINKAMAKIKKMNEEHISYRFPNKILMRLDAYKKKLETFKEIRDLSAHNPTRIEMQGLLADALNNVAYLIKELAKIQNDYHAWLNQEEKPIASLSSQANLQGP